MKKTESQKYARMNITLPVGVAERLERYSKETGIPKSGVIAQSLADYLTQREMVAQIVPHMMQMMSDNPNLILELAKSEKEDD